MTQFSVDNQQQESDLQKLTRIIEKSDRKEKSQKQQLTKPTTLKEPAKEEPVLTTKIEDKQYKSFIEAFNSLIEKLKSIFLKSKPEQSEQASKKKEKEDDRRYKEDDEHRDWFKETFTELFDTVKDFVKDFDLVEALSALKGKLKNYGWLGNVLGFVAEALGWVFKTKFGKLLLKAFKAPFKLLGWSLKKLFGNKLVVGFGKLLLSPFKWIGKFLLGLGAKLWAVFAGIGKAIAGFFGWPALIVAAIAGLGYLLYKYWDEVKEAFTNFFDWFSELPGELWDWIRSKLPSWLGGMSKDEEADYNKRKEEKQKLKDKGFSATDRKEYAKAKEQDPTLDPDAWKKKRDAEKEAERKKKAESKQETKTAQLPQTKIPQQSTELPQTKIADIQKVDQPQQEVVNFTPIKIDVPTKEPQQTTIKEAKQQPNQTIIINKSADESVNVSDYIGSASSVITNMTRL